MNFLLAVFVGLVVSAPVVAGLTGGILGDVDDDGRVDATDMVYIKLYSSDSSFAIPNQGDISLGDINADGQIDSTDVRLIIAYISNPDDPTLPPGIGQSSGKTCSVGLELILGQSCRVDTPIKHGKRYYRFKVKADGKGYYNRFEEQDFPGRGGAVSEVISSSPERIDLDGFQASRIADTARWRIDALP